MLLDVITFTARSLEGLDALGDGGVQFPGLGG